MMEIKCSKCSHNQKFPVEVFDYTGYVCPSCHSYFVGNDKDTWVFKKQFSANQETVWAELGEIIDVGNKKPCIITIIQRKSLNAVGNEYVCLNKDDKDIFFSDGGGYYCTLEQIDPASVRIKPDSVSHDNQNYYFEETVKQRVIYAEGFVFENLDNESEASTYAHKFKELDFFSIETIDGEQECYKGTYWDRKSYLNLFQKSRRYLERTKKFGNQFILSILPLLILPYFIYSYINEPQKQIQHIEFNETFTSKSPRNSFISTPFELKGTVKKHLVYEGFSIPSHSGSMLTISLVNETNNAVTRLRPIVHVANPQNLANVIDIDFCKVLPGRYHFVFETGELETEVTEFKLEEQIKLKYGGYSNTPLIFLYIIYIIGIVIYGAILFSANEKQKTGVDDKSTAYGILFKSGFFIFSIVGLALIFGLKYIEDQQSCESTIKIDTQVDHTGTGSSRIYRRSNFFIGNHK